MAGSRAAATLVVMTLTTSHRIPRHDTSVPPTTTSLRGVKPAYTTRYAAQALGGRDVELVSDVPRAGDLVVARVTEIGQHKKLESPDSRRQTLFVGDEVLVAYGHRYAPDQFEAVVPDDLGPVDLVAAGGVAGRVLSSHASLDEPTRLQPLGLVQVDGRRVGLEDVAPLTVRPPRGATVAPRVVVVLGTSMNSGKSTTLACLVHGLRSSGLRVAAGKATGTGAGGDPRLFTDAGAHQVLDFTHYGLASTYRLAHDRVRALFATMVEDLGEGDGAVDAAVGGDGRPDVVVVEVADGVYQQETERLLQDPIFTALVDDVVFAAGDALGAVAGSSLLGGLGLPVRAISGRLTASPLAAGEARRALDLPVYDTYSLCEPQVARRLVS